LSQSKVGVDYSDSKALMQFLVSAEVADPLRAFLISAHIVKLLGRTHMPPNSQTEMS